MQDLRVTLVQSALSWEDIPSNLNNFQKKVVAHDEQADLIILPEMFNTGFTMKARENAERSEGITMQWMAELAETKNCVISGSLIIKEDGKYYNRFIWMNPDGSWQFYDKKHLFRMGDEHLHYSSGKQKLIVELKGWKIMPLICYDLRFPVWSKNTYHNGQFEYDLLIYVANWPAVRSLAWETLLKARAIENMAYAAGVNRVGVDGRGYEYSGDSLLASPAGELKARLASNTEEISTRIIEFKELDSLRKKLGVGFDWDSFTLD